METRKIFVGLGNPGDEYANTYHNVGALALEKFLSSYPLPSPPSLLTYKNLFEYTETADAIFIRPLTYMNDSGKAVLAAMKKFPSSRLFIFHDDSDLPVGTYKISFARGSAGHKGVQSVIDVLGTNTFTRIRVGIRPARERVRQKAGEFALKQITKGDRIKLEKVFSEVQAYLQQRDRKDTTTIHSA